MKKLKLALGAALLLAGGGLGVATAAPSVATLGLLAGDGPSTEVAYRRHQRTIHHHRAWRRHHVRRHRHYGHPNARNPSRPGYMQQLGNTAGGPRY